MNEITKQEEEKTELSKTDQNFDLQDVSSILSNDELKEFMSSILEELDFSRQESLDMYYIFKDMIANSGDFDSSQAVKEQVAVLLKTAQDASNAKMKIFESLLKSKLKQQTIEHAEIKQNNVFMSDRRSLLKELEKMKEEDSSFSETIEQSSQIEDELEIFQDDQKEDPQGIDKKEENIISKGVNNNEEVDFEIESGDFE